MEYLIGTLIAIFIASFFYLLGRLHGIKAEKKRWGGLGKRF